MNKDIFIINKLITITTHIIPKLAVVIPTYFDLERCPLSTSVTKAIPQELLQF